MHAPSTALGRAYKRVTVTDLPANGETPLSFSVLIGFDEVEHRYYVIDSDIPGLHVESETFEGLVEAARDFVPDLVGDLAAGVKIEFRREIALV